MVRRPRTTRRMSRALDYAKEQICGHEWHSTVVASVSLQAVGPLLTALSRFVSWALNSFGLPSDEFLPTAKV